MKAIFWMFRKQWQYAKMSFLCTYILIPIYVIQQFILIYLPKSVVAQVLAEDGYEFIVFKTAILIGGLLICAIFNKYFEVMGFAHYSRLRQSIQDELMLASLNIDYQVRESQGYQNRMQRAKNDLWWSGALYCPTTRLSVSVSEFLRNILGYLLFGSVVAFISPWITLILTVTPIVSLFLLKQYNQYEAANREKWTPIERKLWYIANNSRSFETAKDIRIYGLNTWFSETFKVLTKERLYWNRKLLVRGLGVNVFDLLLILIRDGAAYYILISRVLQGTISIDQFILYFAAVGSFANWVGGIIEKWSEIHRTQLQVKDIMETIHCTDTLNRGKGMDLRKLSDKPDIQINHMSFQYEGAEIAALKDINLHIRPGEKLAIVGLNGAGKTTLIKNISGLYKPTSGEVRIAGHTREEFNIYDYYSLFSVVSQNADVFTVSIAEIVASAAIQDIDRKKVENCLELAGLGDKVRQLKEGIDTMLNKQLYENGEELSGGEMQKLLLAKAIYKNAPILILDEPTAALDPIAENAMYLQYNELTKGRTSIFISHRLSSTRFCDRIILLEDGCITETGNHDELMALNGKYAELFRVQSQYYKEEGVTRV